MILKPFAPSLLLMLLLATSGAARADGQADLRAALARLQGQAPLKATAQAHDWRRTGDGKDAKETQGQASIALEDGPRGLQPLYSHELLARADAESRAAIKDKATPKPLSQALAQLGFNELRALSSAAPALQREIDDARKYVREFKLALTVWIATDGTPLASLRHQELTGRAFVVVSFEQRSDERRSYAVVGDRLVAASDEEKGSAKGAGETQEYRIERSLQVLP